MALKGSPYKIGEIRHAVRLVRLPAIIIDVLLEWILNPRNSIKEPLIKSNMGAHST